MAQHHPALQPLCSGHRLTRSWIALATALSLVSTSARATEPAPTDPTETARLELARKHYEDGKYLRAASLFEELARETQNPLYLYYAGLGRENVGHDAHAILHWKRALAGDRLSADIAAKARSRLEQAQARTTALTLSLTPPGIARTATLELQRQGAADHQPLTLAVPEQPIHLEAGEWRATVTPQLPGIEKVSTTFSIPARTATHALALSLPPIEHAITFALAPGDSVRSGVTLVLRDPEGLVPDRRVAVEGGRVTVALRAGAWHYSVEALGLTPQSGTIVASADAPPQILTLSSTTPAPNTSRPNATPDPKPVLPPPTRRRLALGLGLGALAPLAAGATLTGIGVREERDARSTRVDGVYDERSIDDAYLPYLWGPLLLGSASGLLLGTVVASRPIPRSAWHGLLGAGVAIGAVGLIWNFATYRSRNEAFTDPDNWDLSESVWRQHKTQMIPSAVLIGFGAGLMFASMSALLTLRNTRRLPHTDASLRMRMRGLGLHLAF